MPRDVSDCLNLVDRCELEARRALDPEAKRLYRDLAIRCLRAAETFDYFPIFHSPVRAAPTGKRDPIRLTEIGAGGLE